MIPTAEEFLDKKYGLIKDELTGDMFADYVSPNDLIEFAKMHVEAALKAAYENVFINDYDEHEQYSPHIDKDSIIKAYPLTNIK